MKLNFTFSMGAIAAVLWALPVWAQSVIELPLDADNCAIHRALSPETSHNCNELRGRQRGIVLRIDDALNADKQTSSQAEALLVSQPIAPTVVVASATQTTGAASSAPAVTNAVRVLNPSHAAAKSENGYFIQFAFDSTILEPEFQAHLNRLSEVLIVEPMAKTCIKIIGHTDTVGSDAYNHSLSDRRARKVAAYLSQKRGIPSGRLSLEAAGEKHPLPNVAGDHALNRRVEFATRETDQGC